MAPLYAFMVAAPLFAAFLFDARGSYTLPILVLAGLGVIGALLFIFAKKPNLNQTSGPPLAQKSAA